jgi:hypothetical protein
MASNDNCGHRLFSMLEILVENKNLEGDRVVPSAWLFETIDEISLPRKGFSIIKYVELTLEYKE